MADVPLGDVDATSFLEQAKNNTAQSMDARIAPARKRFFINGIVNFNKMWNALKTTAYDKGLNGGIKNYCGPNWCQNKKTYGYTP
jgi:hypothetical protein